MKLTTIAFVAVLAVLASALLPMLHPAYPVHQDGTVVITGCSRGGLGWQLVKEVLRTQPESVKVVCTVRKNSDAEELVKEFGSKEPKANRLKTIVLDVRDEQRIKAIKDELANEKIIALVNNAGALKHQPIETMEYRDTIHINLFGVLDMTQALLPLLRKNAPGSRIVNVGSMAGYLARPGSLAYSTSKRAVQAATDAMRIELLKDGIAVSVIEPGFFGSKMCSSETVCTGGIDEVSDAVLHALFAPRPKTKYPVGTLGVMPAFVGAKLANVLPDRVLDQIILRFDPSSRE